MAIQTIYSSDIGNDFIDKLNENFAECVTGGVGGDVSVKLTLQGGQLKADTSDGNIKGYANGRWCQPASLVVGQNLPTFTYTDDNYNNYLHTPCYISLRGNKLIAITTPTGSVLTIFCYDNDFTLLDGGVVNVVDDIPDGAAFVKMQIYNSSGYANILPLEATFASRPQFVKNSFEALVPQFHNYEVKPPKLWDTNYTVVHSLPTDATVDADNTRYHDNCFVILPPNYDPQGEPCKFVIMFAGDGAMWFIGHTPYLGYDSGKVASSIYETDFKYLCNCGYAVVSLGGYTSMWSSEPSATSPANWSPRISPAYMASLRSCYDFLMRNYNFDPCPYLSGKSAGGYMMLNTAATLPFKVRAVAGFSIAVSMANGVCQVALATQKSWQKRCGCSNWNSFVLNSGSAEYTSDWTRATKKTGATANQIAEANRLIANNDIYRNLDQFTAMSDVDYDDFMDAIQAYDPFNDANPPQALTDLLAASHKNKIVPVKLWCATEDKSVPFSLHEIFVDWVNQNNGIAELRSYTGDDGTHHTFCGGESGGGKVANNLPTPYGGTMNGVNIGFVEAVEWFKRW